mmetsp:Transcript_59533/g.167721  ORF Transcript_59533/g.167721 Transcript_59533/m.167721 type:complete len:171 (+) Transcript_59533:115-627(+)
MHSTTYNHSALRDLWARESRAHEAHKEQAEETCTVFNTPRRNYRPVLGVSGTLQATPNPCMERDRDRRDEAGVERALDLPPIDLERQRRPARASEADLRWGVPPHQVHHHNFGWTLAGSPRGVFSPRRSWGLALHYSDSVMPSAKRIRDCPESPRAASVRVRPARLVEGG